MKTDYYCFCQTFALTHDGFNSGAAGGWHRAVQAEGVSERRWGEGEETRRRTKPGTPEAADFYRGQFENIKRKFKRLLQQTVSLPLSFPFHIYTFTYPEAEGAVESNRRDEPEFYPHETESLWSARTAEWSEQHDQPSMPGLSTFNINMKMNMNLDFKVSYLELHNENDL